MSIVASYNIYGCTVTHLAKIDFVWMQLQLPQPHPLARACALTYIVT